MNEPELMTLDQVKQAFDTVVWVDRPFASNTSDQYALIVGYNNKEESILMTLPFYESGCRERFDYYTYGIRWRCWNLRPSEEDRKAIPWEKKTNYDFNPLEETINNIFGGIKNDSHN